MYLSSMIKLKIIQYFFLPTSDFVWCVVNIPIRSSFSFQFFLIFNFDFKSLIIAVNGILLK